MSMHEAAARRGRRRRRRVAGRALQRRQERDLARAEALPRAALAWNAGIDLPCEQAMLFIRK